MIEMKNTMVMGFPGAIRGMRQPYKKTELSDSAYEILGVTSLTEDHFQMMTEAYLDEQTGPVIYEIGKRDKELALKLCEAGSEHRKFLRMIHCQVDIKAPLYWWKQFDTLKIGTVANSESTMHTLARGVSGEDFSWNTNEDDDLQDFDSDYCSDCWEIVEWINRYLDEYKETKDERYWQMAVNMLPESYNQTRTVDLNYEVIRTAYHQRKNHKLGEWHKFCDWAEQLPYSEFITGKAVA